MVVCSWFLVILDLLELLFSRWVFGDSVARTPRSGVPAYAWLYISVT